MNYFWKDTTTHDSRLQAGVIAQEVQAVMPELVNTDTKGMLSVNYQGLTPYLIESIKELKKENDDLKQQIAAFNTLKADVEALKAALQTGVPIQATPSVKNAEKTATERK
jgi:Chaperone of endosialidase